MIRNSFRKRVGLPPLPEGEYANPKEITLDKN
jgi:hypothetical protein